jgi:hypothetical protein
LSIFGRRCKYCRRNPKKNAAAFFHARLGLGNALKFVGELASADEILTETLHKLWRSELALQSDSLQFILVESLRQLPISANAKAPMTRR